MRLWLLMMKDEENWPLPNENWLILSENWPLPNEN